jgi:Protein of unknown function (DUF3096)
MQISYGSGAVTRKSEVIVHLNAAHIAPFAALTAGALILLMPQRLNYVIAIYLIVIGLIGVNGIYHFVR